MGILTFPKEERLKMEPPGFSLPGAGRAGAGRAPGGREEGASLLPLRGPGAFWSSAFMLR